MTSVNIKFREDFDWKRVVWSRPDGPQPVICSYCSGPLPEVPTGLWREDGSGISFCDDCVEAWIVAEISS